MLKYTANLGKLKNHIEVSITIESIGLMSALPVLTTDGQAYIQDGELYFYVTKRLKNKQMASGSFYDRGAVSNTRFVCDIIGQLHLALSKVEDCVSEANLLRTVRDWTLPKAKKGFEYLVLLNEPWQNVETRV